MWLPLAACALAACVSGPLAVEQRQVQEPLEQSEWRPATPADLVGQWRLRSISGPAAAVLMDLAYWMDADGRFSGAALFTGPLPTYEVLTGTWTLEAGGTLRLGADSEPALAEVARGRLRLSGTEGSLVLEHPEIR
jgi:hypothetical protein